MFANFIRIIDVYDYICLHTHTHTHTHTRARACYRSCLRGILMIQADS